RVSRRGRRATRRAETRHPARPRPARVRGDHRHDDGRLPAGVARRVAHPRTNGRAAVRHDARAACPAPPRGSRPLRPCAMTDEDVLEVVEPGLLTTVQDGGRPDLAAEGITRGGAADTWSLAVANALVGNAPDAAALELTLVGPTLRALRPVTVAVAGTIA